MGKKISSGSTFLPQIFLVLTTNALSKLKIGDGNGSRTRQSSVFLPRTEVWRLQLPKNLSSTEL